MRREVMLPGYDIEHNHSVRNLVQRAGQVYHEGKNVAFANAGNDERVQSRLCEDCPLPSICGAAIAPILRSYNYGEVPRTDWRTLQTRGIAPGKYELCAKEVVSGALKGEINNAFTVADDDPLIHSSSLARVVDALRVTTDDTVKILQSGQRI